MTKTRKGTDCQPMRIDFEQKQEGKRKKTREEMKYKGTLKQVAPLCL